MVKGSTGRSLPLDMATRRRPHNPKEKTLLSLDKHGDARNAINPLESTSVNVDIKESSNFYHGGFHSSDVPSTRTILRPSICFLATAILILFLQSCASVKPSPRFNPHPNSISTQEVTQRTRLQEKRKEIIRSYQLWTSEDIYEALHEWTQEFPRLVELTSAQEAYNLSGAGTDSDCPFEQGSTGCKTWILTIQDKSQPIDEQRQMPQVLLSGALHGDEVVGPTTVMETARLLLECAACESMPQANAWNGTDYVPLTEEQLQLQFQAAKDCRERLAERGVFPLHRKWLARLVTTRTIIVMPTANSLGYFRRTREEDGIDPNRDFPFDRNNDPNCLQSIAARSLYQLFINNIVQMTLTFHGGMEAVAYEWGAPSRTEMAPDAVSQGQISKLYSRFAGALPGGTEYPVGTMNELVYPVEGGLEDWSYAASWDKELVQVLCTPKRNGGYDASQQPPTNSFSLRMTTVLVETSNQKRPADKTLGTNQDTFTPRGGGNGHISRNIRLSLGMIDLVEPYVQLLEANGAEIWDDIVPLSPRVQGSCEKTKIISIPLGTPTLDLSWTVGGAFTVDHTSLWYATANEFEGAPFRCGTKATTQIDVDAFVQRKAIHKTDPVYGKTRWHEDVAFPSPGEEALHPLETIFTAHVNLEFMHLREGDRITVYAVARVDQEWSEQREASLPPQTHMARVRTDPTWRAEDSNGVVQGRLDWLSIPLTIEIGPKGTTIVEKSVRSPSDEWNGSIPTEPPLSLGSVYRVLTAAVIFSLIACSCIVFRDENDGTEVWSVWMNRRAVSTSDYDGIHIPVPTIELSDHRNRIV